MRCGCDTCQSPIAPAMTACGELPDGAHRHSRAHVDPLYGMRTAYDEVMTTGIKSFLSRHLLVVQLYLAQGSMNMFRCAYANFKRLRRRSNGAVDERRQMTPTLTLTILRCPDGVASQTRELH